MKKLLFTLVSVCSLITAGAQIRNPSHWSTSTSIPEAKIGDEIDLIFSVKIDDNWYLYSTEFPCEDGPFKTTFTFNPHNSYKLVGITTPINPVDKHDKIFDCDVKIFNKKAEFRQRIKVLASPINITGTYDFQVCSDIDGSCIPGSEDFSFNKLKITGTPTSQNKIEKPKFEKVEIAPVDTTKKEEKKED